LPLHRRSEARASSAEALVAIASTLAEEAGDNVLIVYIEDNPSNIAFMQGVLDELPRVRLTCVPNAELGIEAVRRLQPRVVIMDINLPGMSGYEATRRLRESPDTKKIPIIALTAAAMLGDRKRSDDAGFARYLTKPVKVAELLEAIEQLLV
jgi:CheY-like chemotaxis protein